MIKLFQKFAGQGRAALVALRRARNLFSPFLFLPSFFSLGFCFKEKKRANRNDNPHGRMVVLLRKTFIDSHSPSTILRCKMVPLPPGGRLDKVQRFLGIVYRRKFLIKTLLPARLVSFTSLVLKKTPPFAFFHAKSGIFYV